jgi:hypothetical protein
MLFVMEHILLQPYSTTLRYNPLRVPREQTAHANVRQTQPKLDNPLQAKATSSVRRTSKPKAVDVVLSTSRLGVDGWVVFAHLGCKQVGVVNTLGTRADFLAAHEHVVRVGQQWVSRRGHRVGGTNSKWELVERVEVRVVLLEDETAEHLLLWGAVVNVKCVINPREILKIAYVKSS